MSTKSSQKTLQEILERCSGVLDRDKASKLVTPLPADASALENLAEARELFLRSAESFLPPCLQEAVLANLVRADPLAPPTFETDVPDQTEELAKRKRQSDKNLELVRSGLSTLSKDAARLEERRKVLRERVDELSRRADALFHTTGRSALDTTALGEDDGGEADREQDRVLKEHAEFLEFAKERKAELNAKMAALRTSLDSTNADIVGLEQEQAAAAAAATSATSALEAANHAEAVAGVADMTDSELEEAVRKEDDLLRRNAKISDWYRGTVQNIEHIGGVRVSKKRMSDGGGDDEVGKDLLELTLEFIDSGQVMETTLFAANGSLRSVQMFALQGDDRSEGILTQTDVEELASLAGTLPAPANLRLLVREALTRSKCAELRSEHVRAMRRRYLVGYRPGLLEVIITMPAGIVATFRLHPDYPMVAGGAEILALTGVGGWSPSETERLCQRVNAQALTTLMDVMDQIEEGVAELDGGA